MDILPSCILEYFLRGTEAEQVKAVTCQEPWRLWGHIRIRSQSCRVH